MHLNDPRALPVLLTLFLILTPGAPAYASETPRAPEAGTPSQTQRRLSLYSPRVRRSTVMYLRLRLLELREAGLDRARAAIERRLSIDEMLAEPTPAPAASRSVQESAWPGSPKKANGRVRRSDGP
jgi:hypothetical protein